MSNSIQYFKTNCHYEKLIGNQSLLVTLTSKIVSIELRDFPLSEDIPYYQKSTAKEFVVAYLEALNQISLALNK